MAKQGSLVRQYLENISRAALEQYQDIIRDYVKGEHGVYALYRGDRLYYVGLASNLRMRLKQHLKDRHGNSWDRFSVYLTRDANHLRELEALVLRVVRPAGNRQTGKLTGSDNLKRRLARDVDARHRRLSEELLGRKAKIRVTVPRGKKPRARSGKPDLAGVFPRATTLMGLYNGWEYVARVRRDGTINFDGRIYTSVSAAARAARKRPTNGWNFWRVKIDREWVRLHDLS